jgi:hypothetical protein
VATLTGTGNVLGRSSGPLEIRMFEENDTEGWIAPTTLPDQSERRNTGASAVQEVDMKTDLCPLPHKALGCSHVAVPSAFLGQREDFKRFQWQIGIFITANEEDFQTDKAMILFTLSYMTNATAKLWANVHVDWALEEENWGMWESFLETLSKDFGDTEEPKEHWKKWDVCIKGRRLLPNTFYDWNN